PREGPFFPRRGAEDARQVRRGDRASARGCRTVSARSRRPQPGRPRVVPAAPVRRGDRRIEKGAGDRSGGSGGPLHADALLPRHARRERGRARGVALRTIQGGRIGRLHHRTVPASLARRQQRAAVDPRTSIRRRSGEVKPLGPLLVLSLVLASDAAVTSAPGPVTFTDVTTAAGIRFVHDNGAFGKKYLPETLGSGCLFLDFDNDGWQDVLLINATHWPGHAGRSSHAQLYRNNGNGTFTDVTAGSGLDVELYGMGGAAADYDNDGWV